MPVEEHKELRDLVSQTLQSKGVLQKVQAEIRASVFLALEEQDVFKDKNPFLNKPLKDYVATQEGLIAISLIREFLEFFNLEFATMVFDPETHAGIDYTYEGRSKLLSDLKLNSNGDSDLPLLGLAVKLLTSSLKKTSEQNSTSSKGDLPRTGENVSEESAKVYLNGLNGVGEHKRDLNESAQPGSVASNKTEVDKRVNGTKDNPSSTSLASLGNLPPLSKTTTVSSGSLGIYRQSNIKELKTALDSRPGSSLEEEVQSSEVEKSSQAGEKAAAVGSEESEVEDEVSEIASVPTDDNTIDISISKESGRGDYFEEL